MSIECCTDKNKHVLTAAFVETLGHEWAHKVGDYSILARKRECPEIVHGIWSIPRSDRAFVNWANEVHHDLIGCHIAEAWLGCFPIEAVKIKEDPGMEDLNTCSQ